MRSSSLTMSTLDQLFGPTIGDITIGDKSLALLNLAYGFLVCTLQAIL